ncbi:MAG: hypothetical protein HOE90_18555 [Bacteriovoracaceae bacterium]|jgi:hypothetical protein|nr:hypothetical protein [Bacteriovoracaceae bacterium]
MRDYRRRVYLLVLATFLYFGAYPHLAPNLLNSFVTANSFEASEVKGFSGGIAIRDAREMIRAELIIDKNNLPPMRAAEDPLRRVRRRRRVKVSKTAQAPAKADVVVKEKTIENKTAEGKNTRISNLQNKMDDQKLLSTSTEMAAGKSLGGPCEMLGRESEECLQYRKSMGL